MQSAFRARPPRRAQFMYWLGYLVLATGGLALMVAIRSGRTATAGLVVACLYLAYLAWRMNADLLRRGPGPAQGE